MAEQFCDVGRGITLCYETFGDPERPADAADHGARDADDRRGRTSSARGSPGAASTSCASTTATAGRSTHVPGRPPPLGQLLTRRIDPVLYTLTDMAGDAAGLLRELDLGPAHVVGVSMGGMIAQTLAAEYPESVRSLVSVMSTTGNRWKGQPAFGHLPVPAPPRAVGSRRVHRVPRRRCSTRSARPGFPRDEQRIREVAALSYDRGHDPASSGRQLGAIVASGDRTAALHADHGADARDPRDAATRWCGPRAAARRPARSRARG